MSFDHLLTLKTSTGETLEWTLRAPSPAKALLAAHELCPECEVVRIQKKDEWGTGVN